MEKGKLEQKQLEDKLTIACEVAESRLAALWGAIDSVDTKINIALGFASTILGLFAGFYALENRVWPFCTLILFGLAAIAYILLAILSIIAYRAKAWSYRPDVRTLLKNCENEDYDVVEMKRWVAKECNTSWYKNQRNLNKKANLANCVLVILVVETILLTFGLAYAFFSA